ncbi:surfeit locus protein 6 homolog [Amyelois transitella]|uniref:surfeit locus protein 6 homolog n=1 Tax=Amyelois transitella TaxID=680683 RepID=UPI00298FC2F8|nr:surfeit locus protein 6 homolog [Amyelois transitella]
MPVINMAIHKTSLKNKCFKVELARELDFIKNVLSFINIPSRVDNDDNADYEMVNDSQQDMNDNKLAKRAQNIAELEEKLQKIKSQNKFTLKNKLVKKSLSSKLHKKIKKTERTKKVQVKPFTDVQKPKKLEIENKNKVNVAKPVFNNDGKLVFSKFDFANDNRKERHKTRENDPRKLLDDLQQQQEKIRHLEETESSKAKEIKEKVAWKTVLQKAEGQKVKDDPTLLKKSIKRMEQQKKQSKKQWENRIKSVEQKKDERQKKRKENIGKKKKEKKAKIVKAAAKRGRVVI